MKIAVYGGSFQPPHVGHAMVASWLRWTDRADEVWIVPTFRHAFGKQLVPYDRRYLWCQLLAEELGPGVRVSDVEARLDGPSTTYRTLCTLRASHPEHTFSFVCGADQLDGLPRWSEAERLQREFEIIVVGRMGYEGGQPKFPGVSSTAIRQALAQGASVEHLLLSSVREAITKEDLRQLTALDATQGGA